MNKTMPDWMKLLAREKDMEDFSDLCHQYFKLASMRVMQELRQRYNVPTEDIATLTISIFARFLNEGCYAVGAAMQNGLALNDILDKRQQMTLLKILSGEELDPVERDDIETDIDKSLDKFREFIKKKAGNFYVEG